MNTSKENLHGLPDTEALEKLANEYFSALPNQGASVPQKDVLLNPAGVEKISSVDNIMPDPHFPDNNPLPGTSQGNGVSPSAVGNTNALNIKDSVITTPDPHFAGQGIVPQSVAGSGVSPSSIGQANSFDVKNPPTSLPDPHFAGAGIVPQSVAGSGVSPSAVGNVNTFDIHNPPTSLPDPHFAGAGIVPQSVAGSGISPSALQRPDKGAMGYNSYIEQRNHPQKHGMNGPFQTDVMSTFPYSVNSLPLTSVSSFESDLQAAINSINTSIPTSQIPFANSSVLTEPSFYFLSGGSSLLSQKEIAGKKDKTSIGAVPISRPPFDANILKRDFPILNQRVNGRQLVWLDNAATTQKPKLVIDRLTHFYEYENSNVHRAAHELAARATDAYETARKKVQGFINASSANEIVFVRGSTEAINLVAQSWGDQYLKEGDEIVITHLEHHANIVPWQQLAAKKGVKLRVAPVDDSGQVILEEYGKLLGPKTKLVSFTQVSNALGTITPAKVMVEMAHRVGARVLVDGAQAVSHMRADVQALDCDWYVFSGHKVFGPTGIGVLYGKEELLNQTQPWQGGGNMIADVTFEHTKYQNAPVRFEAGTGNIADAVGLGAAIDYVTRIGIDFISQYEHYLLLYATQLLKGIPGLRLIGTAAEKAGVLSFVLEGFKTEDVGAALNKEGIAVRSGHHCAQPILRRFGVEGTVRPSLALYNSCSDIDALIVALQHITGNKQGRR